jgi:OHCU decarboxylase
MENATAATRLSSTFPNDHRTRPDKLTGNDAHDRVAPDGHVSAAPLAVLIPLTELNQRAPHEFADALRPLFEAAGPLARALHAQRPFASYADLIDRAESLVSQLTRADQIEVVSAHPRIGESAETIRPTSALSYREQGFDREASEPPEQLHSVYAELARLNLAYEQRFGFRFVVFVNGRPKSQIVEVLKERLANARDAELQAGLNAMFAIARDRLQSLAPQ